MSPTRYLSPTRILLQSANKSEPILSGEGGLRGMMQRMRDRFGTGKLLRPDVEDDVLRKPVSESKFRYPSPGAQQPPVVPQGPYQNVFDIAYHNRDVRRRHVREQVNVEGSQSGLPPTAGTPPTSTFLGMAGDFDVQK